MIIQLTINMMLLKFFMILDKPMMSSEFVIKLKENIKEKARVMEIM